MFFLFLLFFKFFRLFFIDLLLEEDGFGMLFEGVGILFDGVEDGDLDFFFEEDDVFGIKFLILEFF